MIRSSENSVVKLQDVSRAYQLGAERVHALKSVAMTITSRRLTAIVGPSGSGKTTLLNILGCIDVPTAGSVEISGQEISLLSDDQLSDFRAKKIGFIFQNFNLIPVLSAYENVEYPLLMLGTPQKERSKLTMDILEAVGLREKYRHRPNELSGGQMQRVAIARALVKQPAIVLADEPTANLDSQTGAEIIQLMMRIQQSSNTTFIVSTHDAHLTAHAQEVFTIRDGGIVSHTSTSSS